MSRLLFPGKLKKGYLVKSPPLDGTALTKIFKGWKRRWCVLYLSDGKLYFQYYENEEKSHTGCPKNTLLLEDCKEITFDLEHPEYDNVFSIMLPERTYYFSAVSAFEMVDWVDKIREPLDLKRAGSLKVQKSVRRTTIDTPSSITSSPLPTPPSPLFPGGSRTLQAPRSPGGVIPGGSHTLQALHSPGGVTITSPVPPINSPTSPYNGLPGFCTLPRQHVAKTTSSGSSEYPPLPSRNKLRDQHDELPPPPPPPHNPVRGRLSVDLSNHRPMLETIEQSGRPLLQPRSQRAVGVPDMISTNTVDEHLTPPLPPKVTVTSALLKNTNTYTTGTNYEQSSPSRSQSIESPVIQCASTTDQAVGPPLPPKPQPSSNVTPPKVPPRKNSSTTEYVNFEVLPEPEKRPVPAPRIKKPIPGN